MGVKHDFMGLIVKSWILCTSKLIRANLRDELWDPPENDRMSPKFGPLEKENSLPTSIFQEKGVSFRGVCDETVTPK